MSNHSPATTHPVSADSMSVRTAKQIGIAVFAFAAVLLGVAFNARDASITPTSEDLVVRCDQLSAVVGRQLAATGIAPDGAQWRRQKQSAFRACIDDYAAFAKLVNKP